MPDGIFFYMRSFLFLVTALLGFSLHAQRDAFKVIDAKALTNVVLDAKRIFEVDITVHDAPHIAISTHAEGEFSNDLYISSRTENGFLYLGTAFQPAFQRKNDKLSAHKVISFSIRIKVPSHIRFQIESDIANVTLNGNLPFFRAYLQSGFCSVQNFGGEADISTQKGSIEVRALGGIIQGSSKNGSVAIEKLVYGTNKISLKTIDGDIRVRQSQ